MNELRELSVAGRMDRLMLWCVVVGAVGGAMTALVFTAIRVAELVGAAPRPLELVTSQPLSDIAGPVETAVYTSIALEVDRLSAAPTGLLVAGALIGGLGIAATALAIARLGSRLLGRSPVLPTIAGHTVAAGGILAITSLAAQGTTGFGQMLAADELAAAVDGLPLGFTIELTPIVAGLALSVLGFVITLGERFERDAEGLV